MSDARGWPPAPESESGGGPSAGAADPPDSPSTNKLLAALPVNEYQRLTPHLQTMDSRLHQVLLRPQLASNKVYFPGGGVCSITLGTTDGQVAGLALVGNEGAIGLPAFGSDPESGLTATVEVPDGTLQIMDVSVVRREIDRGGPFADLIDRYTQAFAAYLMQSVACNALHPVGRRFARCLLEIRDRLGSNELPVTQAALAGVLGVRRATVTMCAIDLQRADLVGHSHRHFVIHDPKKLEDAACECYQSIKRQFARLLSE